MHYIRHMWNATSKSNVEPQSNFRPFQSQIRQSRFLFETIEFSWFRRPISKQLPLELNQAHVKMDDCMNWVMIIVSTVSKNTGRYADAYRIFDIPVNCAFNVPHYITSYMHHICKKKRVKKRFKKEIKIRLRKICFKGIRTRTFRIS